MFPDERRHPHFTQRSKPARLHLDRDANAGVRLWPITIRNPDQEENP
jgi:hypothetical protein